MLILSGGNGLSGGLGGGLVSGGLRDINLLLTGNNNLVNNRLLDILLDFNGAISSA